MLDDNVKNTIGWWKLKAERQTDPFIKFILFYMCFDAWITSLSGLDRDAERINWFLHNDNCLKSRWLEIQSPETKSWLNGLKNLSPVEDMRPKHRGEMYSLTNIEDLSQVVRFIYKIRCNLFHGSKDPNNNRDASLVELAGNIMGKWITWAHLNC